MISGLKSGAQLKTCLKERVHLVLFITSRSYSCFQLLRLFSLKSYNKNKVFSDFSVMRGNGVPRFLPLTGPLTTRSFMKAAWTTQTTKPLRSPQSLVWEARAGGERRTGVCSHTEAPVGATLGLALADCGVAPEVYRNAPPTAGILRPSS